MRFMPSNHGQELLYGVCGLSDLCHECIMPSSYILAYTYYLTNTRTNFAHQLSLIILLQKLHK